MRTFFSMLVALILNSHSIVTTAQSNKVIVKLTDSLTGKPLRDVSVSVNDSVTCKANFGGYIEIIAAKNDLVLIAADKYEGKIIKITDGQKYQMRLDKEDQYLEFSGGVSNFYEYFQRNLRYPEKAINRELQADVYVEFNIDSLGRSHLINVLHDESQIFTKGIERVFNDLPGTWSPEYSGKILVLPVSFRINGTGKAAQNTEPKCDRVLKTVVIGYHKF